MVYYTCLFCRKEFLKKYNYIRHKRTEIICIEEMNKSIHKFRNMNFIKIMREIIDIINYSKNEEDSDKSESSEKSCTQISPKLHPNCTQIAPENPKNEVLNVTRPSLNVFPNPAERVLNVNLDGIDGIAEIQMFDVNGVQVLRKMTSNRNNQLEMAQLPSGVYMLKVVQNGKLITKSKVVKQ